MKSIQIITTITLITFIFLPTVFAQINPAPCPTGTQATGLVSAGSTGGVQNFGNPQGVCAADPKAAFVSYKIPTYADLKSIYFDQSTLPDSGTNQQKYSTLVSQTDGYFTSTTLARSSIHYIGDSLTINNDLAPSLPRQPTIVFVQNDLNFRSSFTYGNTDQSAGMVFVVGGNVNIDPTVIEIDAIIITDGTICTAYNFTSNICYNTFFTTSQLVINGSLISLNVTKPIQFKRTLNNNAIAAEVVNHQPKYLVILRGLFASPLQKWSEIQ